MKNFDLRKPQPDSPEVTVEKPSDLQFGRGATVSSAYVQERARALFADALFRLVPETTTTFFTPAAVQLFRTAYDTTSPASDDERRVAESKLDQHIATWQERYRLHDPWIKPKLLRSLVPAIMFPHWKGLRNPGPLSLSWEHVGVHGLDEGGMPLDSFMSLRPIAVGYEPTTHTLTIGDIGTFDPRQQTVDNAMRTLMPALEVRLKATMEAIVAEDLEQTDSTGPVQFKKVTPFEWLVRFQVMNQSRASIARSLAEANGKDDLDLYRSHVGREVQRVAKLIGITLRTS